MPEFLSKSEVIKLLSARNRSLVEIKDNLPESLKTHSILWNNYPANAEIEKELKRDGTPVTTVVERRQKDVNYCFNAITSHLNQTASDPNLLAAFKEGGLLRNHVKSHCHEDHTIHYMREILAYISLITDLPAQERNAKLTEYPHSITGAEYACLEGTRDRLQSVVIKMKIDQFSPANRSVLEAHDAVVEQARIKFSPTINEGNQPHLTPALEYIYGFDDQSKSFAKPLALMIAAEKSWQEHAGYVDALNQELQEQRERNIQEIIKLIDANPLDKKESWFDVNKALESYGIRAESISDYDDETCLASWNKAKIPTLFAEVAITNQITLPVPSSLFSADAPRQIADLVASENPAHHELGIKALSRMGHPSQKGATPIQFIKTIHLLGLEQQLPNEALDLGAAKLLSMKSENTPTLSAEIDAILHNLKIYRTSGKGSFNDMSSYESCLSKAENAATLPIGVLLAGNAPAQIFQQRISTASSAELGEFFNNLGLTMDRYLGHEAINESRAFFNPEYTSILDSLLHRPDVETPPEIALKFGKFLVHKAAASHDLDLIKYVQNGFSVDGVTHYTNGSEAVKEGLIFRKTAPQIVPTGLENLAYHDARDLKGIIGEGNPLVSPNILNADLGDGLKIIHKLTLRGDLVNLRRVLDLGGKAIEVDAHDRKGWTAAHCAAHECNVEIINLLKSKGANLNNRSIHGNTPLMVAVGNGHPEAVKALIGAGADITVQDNSGWNALHHAAETGNVKIINLLKDKGAAFLNKQNNDGLTPLMIAAQNGHLEIVKTLIDAGANLTTQDNGGFTLLHRIAISGGIDDISVILNAKDDKGNSRISPDTLSRSGHTPLMMLLANGNSNTKTSEAKLKIAKNLLKAGAYDLDMPEFSPLYTTPVPYVMVDNEAIVTELTKYRKFKSRAAEITRSACAHYTVSDAKLDEITRSIHCCLIKSYDSNSKEMKKDLNEAVITKLGSLVKNNFGLKNYFFKNAEINDINLPKIKEIFSSKESIKDSVGDLFDQGNRPGLRIKAKHFYILKQRNIPQRNQQ